MRQLSAAPAVLVVLVVTTFASCTSSAAAASEDPKVNPNARLLLNFKERVDQYVEVRKKAEAQAPRLKPTEDPAEIRVAQEALAQRIRALRANAKHGGIFTPEISAYFRRVLRPAVADKTTKQAIFDHDHPGNIPYLKVNAVYPDDKPLSTVPPNVLMTLPALPDDIEYRFVDKHMILLDARANLIVDYIPNVVP